MPRRENVWPAPKQNAIQTCGPCMHFQPDTLQQEDDAFYQDKAVYFKLISSDRHSDLAAVLD